MLSLDSSNAVFNIESASKQFFQDTKAGLIGLNEHLKYPKVDFEVKVYFPKRFEALRRFYCGTHSDFLKSIFKAGNWAASGGKAFL